VAQAKAACEGNRQEVRRFVIAMRVMLTGRQHGRDPPGLAPSRHIEQGLIELRPGGGGGGVLIPGKDDPVRRQAKPWTASRASASRTDFNRAGGKASDLGCDPVQSVGTST